MRHSTLLASFVLSTVSFVPAVLSSTHRVAADVDMPAALKSLPLSSPVSDERGTEAERFQSSSHRKTSPGKSKGDGTKWKAPIPAEDIKPSTDISTEDGGFIVPDVLSIPFVWLFTSLLEKKGLRDGASGHMPTDQSSSTNVDKKRSRSSRSTKVKSKEDLSEFPYIPHLPSPNTIRRHHRRIMQSSAMREAMQAKASVAFPVQKNGIDGSEGTSKEPIKGTDSGRSSKKVEAPIQTREMQKDKPSDNGGTKSSPIRGSNAETSRTSPSQSGAKNDPKSTR